ncbi:amino acid/polyamine/organocation transporter, APC superfamily [Metallosphaera sedula]|uniref:Amino acid/polyamine/organocation transporter, APC superfamily n=2 Tax=Metallosphaera sedula TaxID=43687 RepID=A4YGB8_METS5|nr:APC family permease [Metallosphaera sedula]ABP95470.1 amino acid/polyamine/organocation transporter, APC superfamily [Metallosphaera sedula DSM 5348]AIM27455.1 amino acid/polyamine/organocation transporter, APC superfamily [Metallosphaera sedula]AKV74327.1 amino acid transporter [Metallosphaera sedula]AKV76566.1 amino acid transporter [Metallosphaera sedula]AKV78818.1 amino acid transporter [Metallosphaera sedula]
MSKKELAKGSVSYREVVAQGVGGAAPAMASLVTLTGAAAYAYGSFPLAVLLATVAVLLDATRLSITSRYVQSARGIYAFISEGLGKKVGYFVGWAYVLYALTALVFIYLSIGVFLPGALQVLGINTPGWIWAPLVVAVALFGGILSYLGIRPSLKFTLTMSILEIAFILGTSLLIFTKVSPDPATFTLKYAPPPSAFNVGVGMAFVFLAFAGYETTSVLGEEAVDPKNTITKGVFTSALLVGITYLMASEAFTVGWGVNDMSSFFSQLVPGIVLGMRYGGFVLAVILTILLINSGLTDSVTFFNTVSRVVYAMARDGVLDKRLEGIHDNNRTPHVAILFSLAFSLLYTLIFSAAIGPANVFLSVGITTTFGFLIAIFTANISLLFILRRFSALNVWNVLLTVIINAILGFVIFANIVTTAVNSFVLIGVATFAGWMIIGAIYYWLRKVRV